MNLENAITSHTVPSLQLFIDNDLYLKDLTIDDAPAIHHIIDSTRDYLRKWLPFIGYSDSLADAEDFIHSVTTSKPTRDIVFTVVYQNEVVGIAGFKSINGLSHKLILDYWVDEAYRGKGITSRACARLIEYAFAKLRMNRIQIKVPVGNDANKKIPLKLNFKLEGVEREGECIGNSYVDMEVYSLLKREWQEQHPDQA